MNLTHASAAELTQAHGLRLDDPTARELVRRWHEATTTLRGYIGQTSGLDLVDVSTLAEMFVRVVHETE